MNRSIWTTAAVALALALPACRQPASPAPAVAAARARYQCSMHPQVVTDAPGNCPICGMRLSKIEEAGPSAASAPRERKIIFYRHPMRPDVTSPVPAKDEMGMDYVPVYSDEVGESAGGPAGHAAFTLSPERQQMIGVKTSTAEYRELASEIRASGKVAFDPDLYNALVEYREALKARDKAAAGTPEDRARAKALTSSVGTRLRLLGLTEPQMESMARETDGSANLLLPGKTTWVYAQVYEDEIERVKTGGRADVTSASAPGRVFEGRVMSVDPVMNAATRTARVRVRVASPGQDLRPEMFVNVIIRSATARRLAVPEGAVLFTAASPMVFVAEDGGRFVPRAVQPGLQADGFYEILSGLKEGERVVTAANFLIDSESRFQSAAADFAGGSNTAPSGAAKR